ncbi:MAG: penicillin-binding protein 2 [Pseudomonadota bacterium]|nr:penicillin-binding protein 2 [Pseudomonadota bacterium]
MIGRQPFYPLRTKRTPPVPGAIEIARIRLMVAGSLAIAAFLLVAVRLTIVTVLPTPEAARAETQVKSSNFRVSRTDILDRNGQLLATNLDTFSLYANPNLIQNPKLTAQDIVAILPELREESVVRQLKEKRDFVWIKRRLTPEQKYAINKLGKPGLDFKTEERRFYPAGEVTGRIVGFTNIDNRGISGFERKFDRDLTESDTPLSLSIDLRVQHLMYQALRTSLQRFKARAATGIILDANNGQVISMVSLPGFNPNYLSRQNVTGLFNLATQGVYEMGSTFKIFTIAMALDSGEITIQDEYDASKPIRVGRFLIRDYRPKNRWLSIPEILLHSSNIGSAKIALDIGRHRQRDFLGKLGLLERPTLELDKQELGSPIIPNPWRDVNAMTIAYGHGIAVSPIQITSAVAAVINGGIYYEPTLLLTRSNRKGRRIISKNTSDKIRRLLRLVVSEGSGRKAEAKHYLVGGKTGTAEKVRDQAYERKALRSSFVGAFPMNKPKYVVFAMVDEPIGDKDSRGHATGGWVAAPLVGKLIAQIAPLLGVKPINYEIPKVRNQMAIGIGTKKLEKKHFASF